MRLGVRAGPFFLVSGRLGCAPWIGAFVVLTVVIALAIDHPVAAAIVGVAAVALMVVTGRSVRGRVVRAAAARLAYERSIVAYVPCPLCGHPTSHRPGCAVGAVEPPREMSDSQVTN